MEGRLEVRQLQQWTAFSAGPQRRFRAKATSRDRSSHRLWQEDERAGIRRPFQEVGQSFYAQSVRYALARDSDFKVGRNFFPRTAFDNLRQIKLQRIVSVRAVVRRETAGEIRSWLAEVWRCEIEAACWAGAGEPIGADDIFCLTSSSTARSAAMFWAICSCLAASCSTLRRTTSRVDAKGASCCIGSVEVAATTGDFVVETDNNQTQHRSLGDQHLLCCITVGLPAKRGADTDENRNREPGKGTEHSPANRWSA